MKQIIFPCVNTLVFYYDTDYAIQYMWSSVKLCYPTNLLYTDYIYGASPIRWKYIQVLDTLLEPTI